MRSADKFVALLVFAGKRRQSSGIEGRGGFGIDRKLANNLVFTDLYQVGGGEVIAKFFLENIGILVADDKGNKRADIAKNGVLDGPIELVHVLVGNDQI